MTLFLVPARRLHKIGGTPPPSFPAAVTVRVALGPGDAFGVVLDSRTTGVAGDDTWTLEANPDEGSAVMSGGLIEEIRTAFQVGRFDVRVAGNILTLSFPSDSETNARETIRSAIQLIPPLLTLHLHVYVWVKLCEVTIGGQQYKFQLPEIHFPVTGATTEHNTGRLKQSIEEWLWFRKEHQSLVSALYYYRQAKRLAAIQPCPEPFVSEIVLNLAKAIEIVFRTPDHELIRARAREWQCDMEQVEQFLIPILILRNKFDVAHPAITPLTFEQRSTVSRFSMSTIRHVGMLLIDVSAKVRGGLIALEGSAGSLGMEKRDILDRIAGYLAKESNAEGRGSDKKSGRRV